MRGNGLQLLGVLQVLRRLLLHQLVDGGVDVADGGVHRIGGRSGGGELGQTAQVLHLVLVERLQLAHIGGGGALGGGQAELFALHLLPQGLYLLPGLGLRLGQQLGLLALRVLNHLVGHPLGGEQSLTHGVLGGAVFLHLFHQHLHLALQDRVFLVKGGVVLGEHIQELIHHRHVVAPEGRLGKGVLGDLLRSHHTPFPRFSAQEGGAVSARGILSVRTGSVRPALEVQPVVFQLVDQIS